nr:hypothetical protein [Tanacetum cinerariifolium]
SGEARGNDCEKNSRGPLPSLENVEMISFTSSFAVDGHVEWQTSNHKRWFVANMEFKAVFAQLMEANVCPSSLVKTWDSIISLCKEEISVVCGADVVVMDMFCDVFRLKARVCDLIDNGSWIWPVKWEGKFKEVLDVPMPTIVHVITDIFRWRWRQKKILMPSGSCRNDVTTFSDDVTIADMKKPLEDSTG